MGTHRRMKIVQTPSFAGVTTGEFCHADEGGICFRIADKNYLQYKSATQEAITKEQKPGS